MGRKDARSGPGYSVRPGRAFGARLLGELRRGSTRTITTSGSHVTGIGAALRLFPGMPEILRLP
jgi:hypothetical protein